MAEAVADARGGAPFTMRLFDATAIAPIWIGLMISATLVGGFAVLTFAFDWTVQYPSEPDDFWRGTNWIAPQVPVEVLQSLLIGLLLVITPYGLRGADSDLRALRPALELTDAEFAGWQQRIGNFRGPGLPIIGLAGVIVGLLLPFTDGFWGSCPPLNHPVLWWVTLRTTILACLLARAVFIEVVVALRFMRLGRDHARVDLLDLEPLRPFALHGLRSVFFLMSYFALFSLMFVLSVGGEEIAIVVQAVLALFAVATLAIPASGAHQRIRARKESELRRVNGAIRRESESRLESGDAWQSTDARLSDLIVYRGLVESLHTWPIDVSTLLRFGLYLVVGLGSWLGGAFVERLVESALD